MNNPYVKTLEPVWEKTDDVRVNSGKLQELIAAMKEKKEKGLLAIPAWDIPNVQPPIDCKPALWIDYVCWVSAINFAFSDFKPPYGKFTIEYPKCVVQKGALAAGASFQRAYAEDSHILNPKSFGGTKYIDAERMARISLREVKTLFLPIDDKHRIPMIKERWRIFREVGRVLMEKYGGSWIRLFLEAEWRAFNNGRGIVEQLVENFPSFRDVRYYKGHYAQFHKRAQLLVMECHGRAVHARSMPLIKDIEDIGPIADYDVPKALNFFGVLEYSGRMRRIIENHEIVRPGDYLEVENRLAMSYAMKIICDEVKINMAQADYYIWEMGRKSDAPHILVPTTSY